MKEIPIEDLQKILSSNGDGLISHQFLAMKIFHHLFVYQNWKIVEVFETEEYLTS